MRTLTSRTKLYIGASIATAFVIALAITGIIISTVNGGNGGTPGEINNAPAAKRAIGARETSPSPTVSAPAPTAQADTTGKIDKNIGAIASALNTAFTDLWTSGTGETLFSTLAGYGVTPDTNSFISADGTPMFGMADENRLIAGWQKTPFDCTLSSADVYACSMQGDWATTAAGPYHDWPDQLDELHQFLENQVHGPNGSEREIQQVDFTIKMQPDHNAGVISLVNGSRFSVNY